MSHSSTALPPVFSAESPSTPALVDIAAGIYVEMYGNIDHIEPNAWTSTIQSLDQSLRDMERRSGYERLALHGAFAIPEVVLEFGAISAPAPMSYAIWFTQKKIELQKDFILKKFDELTKNEARNLAQTAIKSLLDSRGTPIEALFPVGDPDVATRNISAALELLDAQYAHLSPDIKNVILQAASKGLINMMNSHMGSYDESGAYTGDQVENSYEKLALAKEALDSLQTNEADLAEAGKELTRKATSAQKEIQRSGTISSSTRQELLQFSVKVINASKVGKDVVNAAVALGFSQQAANTVNTLLDVAGSAATAYMGVIAGQPHLVVSGVSNLISSVFGGKRPDGVSSQLKQIGEMLSYIQKQNQTIIENQVRIINNQKQISLNQRAILEIQIETSIEVLKNREFLLIMSTGPITLLENEIEKHGLSGAISPINGPSLSYQQLFEIMTNSGDKIIRGLDQLELIFSDPERPHPVLMQSSYADVPAVAIGSGPDITEFKVVKGDYAKRSFTYFERLRYLEGSGISFRAVTECATYDVFFNREPERDPMLALVGDRSWSSIRVPLIDVGLLLRLTKICIETQFIGQILYSDGSDRKIRSKEQILNNKNPDIRGFEMLRSALKLLDVAISQEIILSDDYFIVDFYVKFMSNDLDKDVVSKYSSIDNDFEIFTDLLLGVASYSYGPGFYDARWVDDIYTKFAREYLGAWDFADHVPGAGVYYNEDPSWNAVESMKKQVSSNFSRMIYSTYGISFPDPAIEIEVHRDEYVPSSKDGWRDWFSDAFSVELHYGLLPPVRLSRDRWPSEVTKSIGPVLRAVHTGRSLKDQEIRDTIEGAQFTWDGRYDDADQHLWQCRTDGYYRLMENGCPVDPAWSRWDESKARDRTPSMSEVDTKVACLFRDKKTGRFDPVLERLIAAKEDVKRHLLAYDIFEARNLNLKKDWNNALLESAN